jgi:dTDP-D-glucose 4,6-dehydratase
VSQAERYFGFKSHTPFEAGLRQTIGWYRQTLEASLELSIEQLEKQPV